jgi:glycosyltransferase involved in cell wall biosynthesis
MKIGILVPDLHENSGGSFTFVNAILSALEFGDLISENELVLIAKKSKRIRNNNSRLEIIAIPKMATGRILRILALFLMTIRSFFRKITFDKNELSGYFLSKFLKKHNIDILWSIEPLGFPVNVPFVTTHWDLGHRVLPGFPEFASFNGEWGRRERRNSNVLKRASLICVGTEQGFREINAAYGVNRKNCLIAPMPIQFITEKLIQQRDPTLFLYPAQFWPHKNHVTLIHAFSVAKKRLDLDIRLVLPGIDKGSQELVLQHIRNLSLEEYIEMPGFITNEELINLYKTARMLLFPTYLGPDNLPPLEAMAFGCPVAVSDIPGAREQFGESAKYFPPDSVEEIAQVIIESFSHSNKEDIRIINGFELVSNLTPINYVNCVLAKIGKLQTSVWNY